MTSDALSRWVLTVIDSWKDSLAQTEAKEVSHCWQYKTCVAEDTSSRYLPEYLVYIPRSFTKVSQFVTPRHISQMYLVLTETVRAANNSEQLAQWKVAAVKESWHRQK